MSVRSATTPISNKSTHRLDGITAKLYGCSDGLDSTQYKEATKLRDLPGMDWTDARVALKRLVRALTGDVYYR